MRELLEHIIASLIDENSFEIEEVKDGDNIRYILRVDPEFIGLIIGKGGKTVRSIRNILRIKAVLEDKGVYLEVVELNASDEKNTPEED